MKIALLSAVLILGLAGANAPAMARVEQLYAKPSRGCYPGDRESKPGICVMAEANVRIRVAGLARGVQTRAKPGSKGPGCVGPAGLTECYDCDDGYHSCYPYCKPPRPPYDKDK